MKIAPEVIAVLEAAVATPEGIKLTGQLDRKLYVATNKVLEAVGLKWSRKAQAHTSDTVSPYDALDSILATGEVLTIQEMGFFETTGAALDRVMELADVQPGMRILEPSAGSGNIVRRCAAVGRTRVDVCEMQEKFGESLVMMIAPGGGERLVYSDFLQTTANRVYDRVVMNPPFNRRLDLAHVLHAVQFLKPGGRLVSVMAAGVRFRKDAVTARFHEQIAAFNPAWEDLPPGSFKASGTGVNTCIVVLERPHGE